jgi:hypothetical protein
MVAARVRRSVRPSGGGPTPSSLGAAGHLDRLRGAGRVAGLVARAGPRHPGAAVALPAIAAAVLTLAQGTALRGGSAWPLVAGALAFAVVAALGGRRPPGPRWGWAVPPLLRVAEYTTVAAAGSVSGAGVGPATYAYLLALIWHDYDAAYRFRHGLPGTGPMFAGFEVRTVVVAALAAVGAGAYLAGTVALAALSVVLAVQRSWRLWRRSDVSYAEPARRGGDG